MQPNATSRGRRASRATDSQRFVDCWLRENLPPFYREFSVVQLAARLRHEASRAGVDLAEMEAGAPLAIEQLIVLTARARLQH